MSVSSLVISLARPLVFFSPPGYRPHLLLLIKKMSQQEQLAILQRLPISRKQQLELFRRMQDGSIKFGGALTPSQDDFMPKVTRSPETLGQSMSSTMDTVDDGLRLSLDL